MNNSEESAEICCSFLSKEKQKGKYKIVSGASGIEGINTETISIPVESCKVDLNRGVRIKNDGTKIPITPETLKKLKKMQEKYNTYKGIEK